jgi:hypothetical protein
MYVLTYDGLTIYDPRLTDRDIYDVSVHLAVDEAGNMSFTVPPTHPHADELKKLHGRLELTSDGVTIWRGRILSDATDFYNSRKIEAEGQLACLNDSIVAPFDFPTDYENDTEYEATENVVEFLLSHLLDSHNAQVSDEQKIKLGNVTVTDPNNYIARSCEDFQTTWACITSRLRDSALGGHFLVRYESDGTYLDYLADYPLTNTQSVAYAQNLLDLSDELDGSELYTAILPVGAEKLTIKDLADGAVTNDLVKEGTVIYSKSAVEKYGRITSIQTWDDVAEATNLRSKAAALLAKDGIMLARTITVTAVDLHCTNDEIAEMRVGRYTSITSDPHGIDVSYALTQLDLDIQDPGNTRITFGATIKTQTDRVQGALTDIRDQNDGQQAEINQTKTDLSSLAQTTSSQITQVLQDSKQIIMSALEEYTRTSDFETYKETVSSQLQILADQIELRFTAASDQITDVSGDVQDVRTEINKYFRFTVDGLVIGEEGNQITLKVDNDRISFLDGGLEVAYISNKQLYITDAHFLNSLRIGKFAFVPRRSGNLSLIRVHEEAENTSNVVGEAVVGSAELDSGDRLIAARLNAIEESNASTDSKITAVKEAMK